MDIYKYACILATAIYFWHFNGFPFADKALLGILSFAGFIFFLLGFVGDFQERGLSSLLRITKRIGKKL